MFECNHGFVGWGPRCELCDLRRDIERQYTAGEKIAAVHARLRRGDLSVAVSHLAAGELSELAAALLEILDAGPELSGLAAAVRGGEL